MVYAAQAGLKKGNLYGLKVFILGMQPERHQGDMEGRTKNRPAFCASFYFQANTLLCHSAWHLVHLRQGSRDLSIAKTHPHYARQAATKFL